MIRPIRADGRIDAGGAFTPVYRRRVVEHLENAAEQRVVLVVAPAGYGKTTALRQFLDTVSDRVVRYDLHADNASLLGFIRGFADALAAIAPDARKTVGTAYESALRSPTPGTDLAIWMHAHLRGESDLVIAIDDVHLTENEPEIARLLASIVERTKGRTRWVFASRSSAGLPVASWMAYQEMLFPVDETDLKFTVEEAREVARASRVGVGDEELHHLIDLTEGWPTAMVFALRSATRAADLRGISASTREMTYRYLAEQVYASLSESDRTFLETASLLSEMDAALLERAGFDGARGRIEELRDQVAFITPDSERDGIYKCHDMFREFLRRQGELRGRETLCARAAQLAAAMETGGETARPLELYALVRDTDGILRLLESCGLALYEEGRGDAVSLALQALPEDARRESALASALLGLHDAAAGRFDQAEAQLSRASRRAVSRDLRAQIVLRHARIVINRGGDALTMLREIEDDAHVEPDSRLEASSMIAVLLARSGNNSEASAVADTVATRARDAMSVHVQARVLQRSGMASTLIFDWDTGKRRLLEASEIALQHGLLSLASRCYQNLYSAMLLCRDDPAVQRWYAQQALITAHKSGDVYDMQSATLILLDNELMRGNLERVLVHERQLAELRTSDASRASYLQISHARRLAWEGRFAEAYRLTAQTWERNPVATTRALSGSLCAVYAAAAGLREPAKAIVTKVLATTEAMAPSAAVSAGEATLFCALAEALAGRHTSAQRLLRRVPANRSALLESLQRCVEQAANRVKLAAEPSERDDFDALSDLGYRGYVLMIDAAAASALKTARLESSDLTQAEIGVLSRLAQGATPKEIAEESGRSLNTIHAHIQNVIGKLGCHGRREAVAIARNLRLIAG